MNRSKVLGKVYHQVISTQVQTKKGLHIQVVHQDDQRDQEGSYSIQQEIREDDIVGQYQSVLNVESMDATTKLTMKQETLVCVRFGPATLVNY